ncbi:MAG: hypothetical protein ACRDGM_05145, partial [bacterium]
MPDRYTRDQTARAVFGGFAMLVLAVSTMSAAQGDQRITIQERFADVNGIRLHYLFAGKGDP